MAEKYKLRSHQTYASDMMVASPQLAILYEAGTGKTMCVLDYLYRMFKGKEITNALIVCPASIVSSWETAIDKMAKFEGYTSYGISQMKKLITIRSFQMVYCRKTRRVRHRDGTVEEVKSAPQVRDELIHPWGAIIVDESQALGNHSSIQTQMLLKASELTDNRFILSGTPVTGGGGGCDWSKLYGQLKFLSPDLWASYKDFCAELVTEFDYYGKAKKYKDTECEALLKNFGIVARLADCVDIPDTQDIDIPVKIECQEEYDDIKKFRNLEKYNIDPPTGGSYLIKLLELSSGFLISKTGEVTEYPTAKTDALSTILAGTDDKVVIFCTYTRSVDRVKKVCEGFGKTVVYDGRSTTDTWREFQYGDAKYLVCHYASGGVGIDLFSSHTMVFFEPSLSSMLTEQAKARIRRTGQTQKCVYYWLYSEGTVEQKVVESVRAGVDISRDLLDDWANAIKKGKMEI